MGDARSLDYGSYSIFRVIFRLILHYFLLVICKEEGNMVLM